MSEKRKDKRGRLLRTGETQDPKTGEYRFSYYEDGKRKNFRSWKLNATDPVPTGKRCKLSLREKEEELEESRRKNYKLSSGNITVYELAKIYTDRKTTVRNTTREGYTTVLNILKRDSFSNKKIKDVYTAMAMDWLKDLQINGKRSYSSIRTIRSVLNPAFRFAVQNGWLERNPFDSFKLKEIIVNDSKKRDALSEEDEKSFLDFIKGDPYYSFYYDNIYILFNTGMRISEFCALTYDDIDFDKRSINIDKQLLRANNKVYIQFEAKTNSGRRVIPMSDGVYEAFARLIDKRKSNSANPSLDGVSNFITLNRNGEITYALIWNKRFRRILEKYNLSHKELEVTPHICRHTYSSKMIRNGMNPVLLSYLMGHHSSNITLEIYTHIHYDDAFDELKKLKMIS